MTHTYNEASARTDNAGVSFGADRLFDDNLILGWSFGQSRGNYRVADRWTQGTLDQKNLGLYMAKGLENGFYIKGIALAGNTHYDQSRFALGHLVQGNFESQSLGGKLELGWHIPVGITPFASYRFDSQHRSAFSENDTTWGNHFYSQNTHVHEVAAGVQLRLKFQVQHPKP